MAEINKVEKIKKKVVKEIKDTLDVIYFSVPCIICGKEKECPLTEMPPKKIFGLDDSLQYICEVCKKEVLNDAVCIISDDRSRYIVITDEIFNDLFNGRIDIPEARAMYVDEDVFDEIALRFE